MHVKGSRLGPWPASQPDGIVLVHGIGQQAPGSYRNRFVATLCTTSVRYERVGTQDLKVHALDGSTKRLRVYEASWADVFTEATAQNTFSKILLLALPWLALGPRARRAFPRQPMLLTVALIIISPWLLVLASVVRFVLPARTYRRATLLTLADVPNYVAASQNAFPPEHPLHSAADEVDGRLRCQLAAAKADGCRNLVVAAHSWGSVVALRVLASERHWTKAFSISLVTYGSPLAWVSEYWPEIVPDPHDLPISWTNFRDRLDPVARRIRFGGVAERSYIGSGGLLLSHGRYLRRLEVLASIVSSSGTWQPRWRRRALALVEVPILAGVTLVVVFLPGVVVTIGGVALYVVNGLVAGAFFLAAAPRLWPIVAISFAVLVLPPAVLCAGLTGAMRLYEAYGVEEADGARSERQGADQVMYQGDSHDAASEAEETANPRGPESKARGARRRLTLRDAQRYATWVVVAAGIMVVGIVAFAATLLGGDVARQLGLRARPHLWLWLLATMMGPILGLAYTLLALLVAGYVGERSVEQVLGVK